MSWRTVVVASNAKLSYKNEYMIIRNDEVQMIHLSEIGTLIIDSTAVVITSYLICELIKNKVKIIYCDNQRNPIGEIIPYYGNYNCSKRLKTQILWDKTSTETVWTEIIKEKIRNQADMLKYINSDNYKKLYEYLDEVELFDPSNREGHSAKVYFDSLFGLKFSREDDNDINASLNYGYSILLSQFNKMIVANGLSTELGIKHINEFNNFNLSSDFMEPFRPIVDKVVYLNKDKTFKENKLELVNIINHKVKINNKEQYITTAIGIYVKSVIKAIEDKDISKICFFEYEL
ncbi:MAG: type II CRISPR-associated endonuclease Cas1 [Thomasclavelia sp.]|nr:type II CRISPR-associated endonuclease Cas1 [Thomasclavelia sp.]